MTAPGGRAAGAGPVDVVLATHNPKKLVELRRVLDAAGLGDGPGGVRLLAARREGEPPVEGVPSVEAPEVAETGATFRDNALLKARAVASATGLPALADDSGLAVDVLNGMPGVLSARWSGTDGPRESVDAANVALLLAQTADVPDDRRGAAFVCAAAVALPDGTVEVAEGRLAGRLAREPLGEGGFGYDPVFVPSPDDDPDGGGRTTAQMAPEDKDAVSHRGRALRALAVHLPVLLDLA